MFDCAKILLAQWVAIETRSHDRRVRRFVKAIKAHITTWLLVLKKGRLCNNQDLLPLMHSAMPRCAREISE